MSSSLKAMMLYSMPDMRSERASKSFSKFSDMVFILVCYWSSLCEKPSSLSSFSASALTESMKLLKVCPFSISGASSMLSRLMACLSSVC